MRASTMSRPGCSTSTTRSIPPDCNLFAQIDQRMGEFIAQHLGLALDEAQALRKRYYYEHGTTLAGLMRLHGISPHAFLDYVHDIDLSAVAASPELGAAIDALPGRKFVFTNGSRKHAEAVAERLGVADRFEDIFDIHALDYIHPKPTREAYERFTRACGVVAGRAAMFDDLPHNLETAHALGMTTVLVHGRDRASRASGDRRLDRAARRISITAPMRLRPSSPAIAEHALGKDERARTSESRSNAQFCLT